MDPDLCEMSLPFFVLCEMGCLIRFCLPGYYRPGLIRAVFRTFLQFWFDVHVVKGGLSPTLVGRHLYGRPKVFRRSISEFSLLCSTLQSS